MELKNNPTLATDEEAVLLKKDITEILKASLAFSEQLIPEKLAEMTIKIIMQESKADKGFLLVYRESQLYLVAEAKANGGVDVQINEALKLPDYNFLPETIIMAAKSKNENIILHDISQDKQYATDKYFLKFHPKSIACIPIRSEKKDIGIIYLENRMVTGFFTPDKIVVIKILATHAAASYQNLVLFNKLNLSKKRFQDILDNSTAVVFAKLLNGKYIFINKEFERLRKINREKVIHFDDFEIFPKEFAEAYVAKDKVISETGKPLTYEESIPQDDGIHNYIVAKFPLLDSDGKIYAIGGIGTDITELKRMEQTLRENQNRFNYVLAATQDSIYDWDLETGRIWRNEQYEKLFDGPSGPSLTWWKNNIHPEDFAEMESRLESAFKRQDQFWNQEYRFKRAKEGYAYVNDRGFIIYDKDKKPCRIIGALMDITERKQFIDELERSLALSRATLESTTDGILVVDLENKIVDYNKKFVEMWNIPDSVLESKEDKQAIGFVLNQLKAQDVFLEKIRELYAEPEKESFDVLEFKDGRIFERYSKPQKTKAKIIGRVWSFRDVTRRKKAEEDEKRRIGKIIERQSELLRLNELISSLPLKEKLKKLIISVAKTQEVERVSVQFFDNERSSLTSENTFLLSKSDYGPGVTIMKKDFPRYFSELGFHKIIDANNAETDPRTSELSEKYLKNYGITSILNVPFKLKGKIVGIICHEHVGPKRIWTYEEMAFANSIADIVSLLLESNEREKSEIELKKINEFLEDLIKVRTAELTAKEEMFRAVVETANDSIISANKNGIIISWNKAAEKMFGYTSVEAIGQPVTLIMPPRYIEKHKSAFASYQKTKVPHLIGKGIVELSGLKKGGFEFPIELSLETWKSNNEDYFTAIIRDISERKEIEKELEKKKEEIK